MSNYNTRNTVKITLFRTKHNFFKNYFFPSTVIEWSKLDPNLRSTASLNVFKKKYLLKFIRPSPNSIFNCCNCKGIKYLTRLRLGLSHFVSINLNIVFKILWIHFVHVALMLKQICIFSFTAPCSVFKDAPFWAQLMILIALWQTLMTQYWPIFFSLVKLL